MKFRFLVIFLIAGFIYRYYLGNLVPQPFVFDATEYHYFALQMLRNGITVWSTRLYGYPIFLALVYKVFGAGNLLAVVIVQIILDCLTAVLVYKTAGILFENKRTAFWGFILYIFNPYTATFTALILSEILAVFLFALVTYLFARIILKREAVLFPLFALLSGYFPQVRPAFLFFSLFAVIITGGFILIQDKKKSAFINIFISLLLFILPFSYNIIGNFRTFNQFSVNTVDNLFVREFYISLFVPGRSPFHANNAKVFPVEVRNIYNQYSTLPKDAQQRKEMADKYLNLGIAKVRQNPGEFIKSRFAKLWYVWEKHFLYYYTQPENRTLDLLTYWLNIVLLLSGVLGFAVYLRRNKGREVLMFSGFFLLSILYVSAVHSISLAEERYSLPVYPLIFLFAGFAINKIITALKSGF